MHHIPAAALGRFAALALLAVTAFPAKAATVLNVTTNAMTVAVDGACSLVEALQASQANATVNECVIGAGGAPFTINLPAFVYTADAVTEVHGTHGSSAFAITSAEVIINGNGATLTRSGPTMRAFRVQGRTLTIRRLNVSGFNAGGVAGTGAWSGAIAGTNGAVVNIEDSTFSGNSCGPAPCDGQAIASFGSTLNIHRSTFTGNTSPDPASSSIRADGGGTLNIGNSTVDSSLRGIAVTGGATGWISHVTVRASVALNVSFVATAHVRNTILVGACQVPAGNTLDMGITAVTPANAASCAPGGTPYTFTLLPIANNGGPTQTLMFLQPASGLQGAVAGCTYISGPGNPFYADGAATLEDQRRSPRNPAACDLGAVQAFTILPSALSGGTYNQAYSDVITANGTPPHAFTVASGSLPPGLALSASGTLAGTPTSAGSFTFRVHVVDGPGTTADISYTVAIAKANQTITFAPLSNTPFGTPPFAVSPTSDSGLAVTLSSLTPLTCSVAGNTVTVGALGTCTLRATQAGDANSNAATPVDQSFAVTKANQAITFAPIADVPFGSAPFTIPTPTSNSGLAVTLDALTPLTCSLSGTTVTVGVVGTCTLRATQAGDANYNAAPQVNQSFNVIAGLPGAPNISAAIGTLGSVLVTFTPPASNGGNVITSYTATCGAQSVTGPASPLTVTGVPGGATSCFVRATNAVGTGPASASLAATTPVVSFSGPTATGTGTASVILTGGGPTCTFAPAGTGALQSSFFIPLTGHPKSPPGTPPNASFPHGLLDFVLLRCTPGSTVTLAVTFPNPVNASMTYWKYGPTPGNAIPHWYTMPATISGNTFTFSITDGGLGDDDLTANGTVVDQGGPGVPAPVTASAIPTLSEYLLALLALMMFGVAWRRERR